MSVTQSHTSPLYIHDTLPNISNSAAMEITLGQLNLSVYTTLFHSHSICFKDFLLNTSTVLKELGVPPIDRELLILCAERLRRAFIAYDMSPERLGIGEQNGIEAKSNKFMRSIIAKIASMTLEELHSAGKETGMGNFESIGYFEEEAAISEHEMDSEHFVQEIANSDQEDEEPLVFSLMRLGEQHPTPFRALVNNEKNEPRPMSSLVRNTSNDIHMLEQTITPSALTRHSNDINNENMAYIERRLRRFKIMPREEEGREELPPYTCTCFKQGYLMMKVEFRRPGIIPIRRPWKSVYVRLRGTALWIFASEPQTTEQESTPLYHLSLQYAEIGAATDYRKRRFVLRLRTATGPQLLLQASSGFDLLNWVEHLQIAVNLAVPIDDRPMPCFVMAPRRRQRLCASRCVYTGRANEDQAIDQLWPYIQECIF
ncbi:uncharacterized protein VTP21DRAFT_2758 [Calcarisporiella thermophila]|uniref:uncharacterized protein n=1 Tax=Calcarisporiella thermophila TaxID=911321 RepID=UPI003743C48D